MPVVDRQKERQIVERAIERGMSQDQIKQAVTAFRAQGTSTETEGRQATALERMILSFGTGAGRDKFLEERGISPEKINKPGFDVGDISALAGGAVRDVPGAIAAVPGALLGGILGSAGGPPGALAGGIAGGATAGAVGQTMGETARQAAGGLLGVAKGPISKEGARELGEETIAGGIAGALTIPGVKVFDTVLGKFAKKPGILMRKALNPTPQERQAYENTMNEIVKNNYTGTLQMMRNKADDVLKNTKELKNKSIDAIGDKVIASADDLVKPLADLEKQAINAADAAEAKSINQFFNTLTETISKKSKSSQLTGKQVDEIVRAMDKNIGKAFVRARQVGETLPMDTEARRATANALREVLNQNLDEAGRKVMRQRHIASVVKTLATKGANKASLQSTIIKSIVPGFSTAIGAQVGTAVGQPFTGAVLGGSVGTAASLGITSPLFRTLRAQAARPAAKVSKEILERVPPAARGVLVNLLMK